MADIPIAPLERILRKSGIERVSEEAVAALRDILEEEAVELGRRAARLATHAGRVTIKAEDVRFAREEF
ncbi:MAG TPA: histone family protein [Candidatus Altiarchaeales archaeon]|nr:histone family protein [Candidatus Altiarchaeales archaeon]